MLERCWTEIIYPWRRQCMRCYRLGRFSSDLKNIESHAFRSYLTEDEGFETVVECFLCNKELTWVRPAKDCRDCVEEFILSKDKIVEEIEDLKSIEIFGPIL